MLYREFTAIYQKHGKWYLAWIEEIPGVNAQGKTRREAEENLKEALELILDSNRMLSQKHYRKDLHREPLRVAIPA